MVSHIVREIECKARNCPACISTGKNLTVVRSHADTGRREPALAPNDEIELEFWGPLAANASSQMYILVAIDRYSCFPFAMCTSGPTASAVLRFLCEYVPLLGGPRRIRTDQGTAFTSREVT